MCSSIVGLLDGWRKSFYFDSTTLADIFTVSILYFSVFAAIAYVWRPTGNNTRLAMSDELATDENDAEEYEVDSLARKRTGVEEDDVVFDIGEEEDDPTTPHGNSTATSGQRKSNDYEQVGEEAERLRRSYEEDEKRRD